MESRLLACLLGISLFAGASGARAEGAAERAAAEAAFAEGVKLMQAGDLAAACKQFESATELSQRKAVGGILMLADCYAKQGRLASAWATYKEVIAKAQRAGQAERERTASQRVAELEPKLPKLRVGFAAGFKQVDGLSVRKNGVELPLTLMSQVVPVDPGKVTVEASAPGFEAFSAVVEVAEGELVEVEIPALAPVAATAVEPAAPEPGPPTAGLPHDQGAGPRDGGHTAPPDHTLAYVVGGVGIAGIVTSGVLGLIAKGNYDTAVEDGNCETIDGSLVCDSPGDVNSARNLGNVATYVFAGGMAVTAVGVLLYLITPGSASASVVRQTARLRPSAAVGPQGAWLGIGGAL
ncbi:MAG: hypothetical protein R3B07_10540 [Polyangiaceae bacterium]